MFFTPQLNLTPVRAGTRRDEQPRPFEKIAADILSADRSPIQMLLLDGANPVFATPRAWKVREALMKVPFIVSFGNFLDETSVLADWILPDHSFLESWVEGMPEAGSRSAVGSVAPPVMRPLHETRAVPDVLLEAGRRLKRPLNPALPWQNFQEMLRSAFEARGHGKMHVLRATDQRWQDSGQGGKPRGPGWRDPTGLRAGLSNDGHRFWRLE